MNYTVHRKAFVCADLIKKLNEDTKKISLCIQCNMLMSVEFHLSFVIQHNRTC